jgi:2-octaprenyl-6-methoxyphenol hydroxylase
MRDSYDVLIIGGGLVGASLACALGKSGLRIGVVESVSFRSASQPSYDDRAIALAQGTQRIFSGMGIWDTVAPQTTSIHSIHVSDKGHFGFTRLDRDEEGVPALGYTVPARALGRVFADYLDGSGEIDMLCPAHLESVDEGLESLSVTLVENGRKRTVTTRLLAAADGADSVVRDCFGIAVTEWDYRQTAIVTNVTPQLDHGNVAYERFTLQGPMALLPLAGRHCAAVWTVRSDHVADIQSLSDNAFLEALQESFGYRLGRMQRVGVRASYPLRLVRAQESVRSRLALIGNAAHTLHPVAGQGFNLGARDVAALAECVVQTVREGGDPGDLYMLQRYADWRRQDQGRVIAFTDGMTRLFSNPLLSVTLLRNAGMLALDFLPPAKRLFTRLTMGSAGRLPRLARGLPL